MADFCTKCANELFGNEVEAEINMAKISEELEADTYLPVLCEGCGMLAVGKRQDGTTMIAVNDGQDENGEGRFHWETLEEWESLYEDRKGV